MNKEQHAAYRRIWDKAQKERQLARMKVWRKANPEKVKSYYETHKKKRTAYAKTWRKNNPDKVAAGNARYRAQRLKAIPLWLSPVMKKEILAKYTEARILTESTGILHQVDHIIPLRGKKVSGLHVPWNLQIIPAVENQKKSNKCLELRPQNQVPT